MSDDITMLPIDKTAMLDPAEEARLRPYMSAACGGASNFLAAHRQTLWLVLAFFILSIPLLDGILTQFTGNKYLTLVLKTIIFVVVVVILSKL